MGFHSLGLYILWKSRKSFSNKSQYQFLIHLSTSQILFVSLGIVSRILIVYLNYSRVSFWLLSIQYVNSALVYFLVMIFMTFDRFFEIYLNIRYPLYWCEKYTKILLTIVWLVASVLVFPILLYPSFNEDLLSKFCFLYFYPFLESIILLSCLIIYTYIFTKLKKTYVQPEIPNKDIKSIKNRHTGSNNGHRTYNRKRKTFAIFVPGLIVLTFILFIFIPDLIASHGHFADFQLTASLKMYIYFSYLIGISCDVFVYILSYKCLRKTFLRIFLSCDATK